MNPTDGHARVARRDWLKLASLGGLAAGITPAAGAVTPASRPVRGVVFLVSDGMSPGVLTLAEAFSRITRKRGTRWWRLLDERRAARGLMDTASANSLVTDSAAASSAWGGGQRVHNGQINIDAKGREITPIAALLKKTSNARIGLVTTATVTHATPAGFAANVAKRNDELLIAPQYLDRVDVILGGGSAFFDSKQRPDRRDLFADYEKAGYQVVRSRDEMKTARSGKLLGTFTSGHLPFSIDRAHSASLAARVPTLAEMAEAALARFLPDKRPFLLQVEGARIDHAAHLNDIGGLLHDQLAFDDALARVLELTAGHDDILVVATSDHGNANPGLNGIGGGYADSSQFFERIVRLKASHERLFSDWKKIDKDSPADLAALVLERLDFQLHPDEAAALHDILKGRDITEWNHLLDKPEGLLGQFIGNHTGIGWTGTTHTTDPTLVSATGPQAERFSGMVKNTDVFRHLLEMLG
ncbi:MAG: alkaline phosphatase [Luteolibacter sp.]